jgi:hypothetical protein
MDHVENIILVLVCTGATVELFRFIAKELVSELEAVK